MEKIAIISDVHGNITALNAVLYDIEKRGIKRIFWLSIKFTIIFIVLSVVFDYL